MFAENKNYFRMVTQNTYLIYVMSVLTQGNRLALTPSCLGFSRFSRCFFVMCSLFTRLSGLISRVNKPYTVYQTLFHLDIHQSFQSNFANFCILTILVSVCKHKYVFENLEVKSWFDVDV